MVNGKLVTVRPKADLTLLKTFEVGDLMVRHGTFPVEFVGAVIPAEAGIQMAELDPRLRGDDINIGNAVNVGDDVSIIGDSSESFLGAIDEQRFPIPSTFKPIHLASMWPQAINTSLPLRIMAGVIRLFEPLTRIADIFAAGNTTGLFMGGVGGGGKEKRYQIGETDLLLIMTQIEDLVRRRWGEAEITERFTSPKRSHVVRMAKTMPEIVEKLDRLTSDTPSRVEALMQDRELLYQGLVRVYDRALQSDLLESEREWAFWVNRVMDHIDGVEGHILSLHLGNDAPNLIRLNVGWIDSIRRTSSVAGLQEWVAKVWARYDDMEEDAEVTEPDLYDAIVDLEYLRAIDVRRVEILKATIDYPITEEEILFDADLSIKIASVQRQVRRGRASFIQRIFE